MQIVMGLIKDKLLRCLLVDICLVFFVIQLTTLCIMSYNYSLLDMWAMHEQLL